SFFLPTLSSLLLHPILLLFFFFNTTAPTEIYTLSLHDALPIYVLQHGVLHGDLDALALPGVAASVEGRQDADGKQHAGPGMLLRSEEHTSELQSLTNLVCRLLLEKKKKIDKIT